MFDYSLVQYVDLCKRLMNASYQFYTVSEFLSLKPGSKKNPENVVIIRHDVDRWIRNSVQMAVVEKNLGIKSTYYFRYPHTFSPSVMKQLFSYGDEIGYHYEVLNKTKGDMQTAWKLFQAELKLFQAVVPVHTVSMHGSPLSPYDSRDLWDHYSLSDLGVNGEAYNLRDDLVYMTDTGRRWDGKYNLRDRMPVQNNISRAIVSTRDLIEYIEKEIPSPLYINIHPERWNSSLVFYVVSLAMDNFFSVGKRMITLYRTYKNG